MKLITHTIEDTVTVEVPMDELLSFMFDSLHLVTLPNIDVDGFDQREWYIDDVTFDPEKSGRDAPIQITFSRIQDAPAAYT